MSLDNLLTEIASKRRKVLIEATVTMCFIVVFLSNVTDTVTEGCCVRKF